MFAAQAALVIANARTHREERQARTDLETLVNTSPVGVAVFDAKTGGLASVNREARPIVDGLREGDQPAEDLLDVMTCVRSDGRELSLKDFTLAELLSAGETVRAEEIVLRVPDGRSVSVLLNATPIHSEEGVLASFVVTLQDLTPLEEQERLRAEFLAMVSHELRTPLAAVKGSVDTLLEAAGELDPAEMTQFHRIIRDQTELAARIRAALRKRLEPSPGEPSVSFALGELSIDYAQRRVTLAGEPVEFTPTEYAVLYELAVHAPKLMNQSVLLQRVWGPERVGEGWLLRDVVKRLRRKLGDAAADPRYIITEPRKGYRMAAGETAETNDG